MDVHGERVSCLEQRNATSFIVTLFVVVALWLAGSTLELKINFREVSIHHLPSFDGVFVGVLPAELLMLFGIIQ